MVKCRGSQMYKLAFGIYDYPKSHGLYEDEALEIDKGTHKCKDLYNPSNCQNSVQNTFHLATYTFKASLGEKT